MLESIGYFLTISGFIFGLGSVTVIDLHGFLAQKSSYWTEATIRTHKITKPLIWIGMFLAFLGGLFLYTNTYADFLPLQIILAVILVANGIYLSFFISPKLLERENKGKSSELLPRSMQNKIFLSFVISFLSWWSELVLFVLYIKK